MTPTKAAAQTLEAISKLQSLQRLGKEEDVASRMMSLDVGSVANVSHLTPLRLPL